MVQQQTHKKPMLKPTPSKPGLFSVTFKRFSRLRGIAVVALMTMTLSVLYLSFVTPPKAYATTNATLNFQARLESSSGAIAPDGTYNIEFKLYSASSGGSAEWTEDYLNSATQGVKVANGYLTVNLGSITAFPNTINWGTPQYLTMNIGSTASCSPFSSCSPDGEMSPRLPLTAVPAAFSLESNINASGYNSNLTLTQPGSGVTTGNENFVVQDQGAAGTYSLLTGGSISGATAGVVLQSGTPGTVQTGNFNVSGTGLLGTLDATGGAGSTLTIGATDTYTGAINIDTSGSVTTGTVTIGGANQTGAITIGQTSGGNNTINIGAVAGNTYTQTINIGTSSTAGSKTAATVGSTVGTSITTVQAGTGGLWLQTGNVSSGTSGNVVIQSGNSTSGTAGNITIDTGSGAVSTGTILETDTFESGLNNWSAWFSSSVAQSTTYAHGGTHSLAITDTASGGGNWGAEDYTTANTVTPGQVYTLTAWVRSSVAEQIYLDAEWNGPATENTVGTVTDTTTGWTEITGSVTAPAGATSVWMTLGSAASYANGTLTYLDDVTITGGSSAPVVNIGATNAASVTIGNASEAGATNLLGGTTDGVNINANTNSPTDINTGTSTGTVNIGNASDTGGVNVLADAASQFVTSAGALTLTSAASASWTVSGTNTLTLGPGGAGTVNLQAGASGGLINIGNNAFNYSTGTGIQIGQASAANTASINIGTNSNASGTQLVTIGTAASTGSTLTLEAGTGAAAIQIGNGATAHGIQIGTGAAVETLTIGSTNTTSATSIQGGTTGSINIGSIGSSTLSSTTHIADTSNATGTQKVTIGSTANTANTVTFQAGATSEALSNTSDIVKNSSNSTSAFQVQATGGNVFTVDTTDNALVLGNDGTPSALTVRGGAASGNNLNGSNITLQASNGTGAGGSGSFIFQTAPAAGNVIGTDNTATTFITTGTSLTTSFTTTSSQTNRFMIVQLVTFVGRSFTGVTYNGVALTRLTTKTSVNAYEEVWYLVGPASGTHNLVATENTSGEASMEAATFYNVDPTTPLGTAATAAGTTTGTQPTSLNVSTSTTAQVVVDAIAIDTATGTSLSNGTGQTQLWNYAAGSGAFVSGGAYKSGTGGTVNMSWNVTSSDWADIGVPLNPTSNSTSDTYSTALDIASTGNIGIDNTNPQYSLDVAGTARIQTTTDSTTAFQVQNSSGVTLFNVDTNGNAITIGNTSSTVTLEGGSGASAIQIGNGPTAHGIQIGTGAAAETVTIGSTNTTSATTIQAGSGDITLNGYTQINQAGIPLVLNSTGGAPEDGALFQVSGTTEGEIGIAGSIGHIINQTAVNDLALKSINGNILFAAGGSSVDLTLQSNGNLVLNNGVLVLYNASSAPTEVDGGMYYNTNDNTFECGDNGSWTSCGNGVLGVLTTDSSPGLTTSSYANFSGASFTPPSGDCQPGVSYLITADGFSNSGTSGTSIVMDFALYQGATDMEDMHNESTLTTVADTNYHSWTWNMTVTCQTLNSVMIQGFATSDGNRGSGMDSPAGNARTGVVSITSGGTFQLKGRWRTTPTGSGYTIVMTNFIVQRLAP